MLISPTVSSWCLLSLCLLFLACLLILCSSLCILVTILRIPSAAGRSKTFSTCSSHTWHCLVDLPPAEGCTHSRNRHGNCTHVHSGHTCSESSYLHLEEQGSEGSLSKPNTEEYCYTSSIKYSQDRNQEIRGPRLCFYICSSRRKVRGFPSDSVVKSLLANKGDTGSIPVSGRSHFLQSN